MTTQQTSLAARASAWRDADPDPQTRAELGELLASGDTAALADRFDGSLAFGTAGIRAEIGAGPMRMNRLVAGRATTAAPIPRSSPPTRPGFCPGPASASRCCLGRCRLRCWPFRCATGMPPTG